MNEMFSKFATAVARQSGRPTVFALACALLLVWAVWGPFVGYSENWQLIINTATTIITFLMVFLIQNTQNRDSEAIHLKLDELIRATKRARNSLLDLEECTEDELKKLRDEFNRLAERKKIKLEIKAEGQKGRGAA